MVPGVIHTPIEGAPAQKHILMGYLTSPQSFKSFLKAVWEKLTNQILKKIEQKRGRIQELLPNVDFSEKIPT